MKVQKYRAGKLRKGKFWKVSDNWKGPFVDTDNVYLDRSEKGKWTLQTDHLRNDGDGEVALDICRAHKLPKWLQKALEDMREKIISETRHKIEQVIEKDFEKPRKREGGQDVKEIQATYGDREVDWDPIMPDGNYR
jgi:hypothetical protein